MLERLLKLRNAVCSLLFEAVMGASVLHFGAWWRQLGLDPHKLHPVSNLKCLGSTPQPPGLLGPKAACDRTSGGLCIRSMQPGRSIDNWSARRGQKDRKNSRCAQPRSLAQRWRGGKEQTASLSLRLCGRDYQIDQSPVRVSFMHLKCKRLGRRSSSVQARIFHAFEMWAIDQHHKA